MPTRATLRSVENWGLAWRAGFLPWLKEIGTRAALETRPTLVIAPDRSALHVARSLALEAGLHALAIHFVTLPQVRDLLAPALALIGKHPLRETLRLLLAAAAEQAADDPAAAAV